MRAPYCAFDKGDSFAGLLRMARISLPDDPLLPARDYRELVSHLDSLPTFTYRLRHLFPLIYRYALSTGLYDKLSGRIQALLAETTRTIAVRQLITRYWLGRVTEELQDKGIPVVLLKGAAFMDTLYRQEASRAIGDLDLLVKRSDFSAACDVLNKVMERIVNSQTQRRPFFYANFFEYSFQTTGSVNVEVDLHHRLTYPHIFSIPEKGLWDESREHPAFGNAAVRILSPEDTLIHLAVHAFRDYDFCTHNLIDAHEIICQWKPDPVKLAWRASAWGVRRVLFVLLENCRISLGTPIPGELFEDNDPGPLSRAICKIILSASTFNDTAPKDARRRALQLLGHWMLSDKVTAVLRFHLYYARLRLHDWIGQKSW